VRHHLVADVPVGAFLSSGVDSGALVGLMRDAGQADIQTLTITFAEFRGRHDDEAPLAELVARQYGTRHSTRIVTEREFLDDLPKFLDAMDQPTIDGVNTWFVAKATRELGLKVAISGLGGDELFGGYSTFNVVPQWVKWLSVPSRIPLLGESFRRVVASLAAASNAFNPKAAGLLKYGGNYAGAYLLFRGLFMQWELDAVLDPDTIREGLRQLDSLNLIDATMTPVSPSAFSKVAALESSLYMRNQLLRDTDWASMAHSLEVRVPLVDAVLLDRVAPVVAAGRVRNSKALLAASPSKPLPQSITNRRKTGFGTPVSKWLQRSGHFERWRNVPELSGRHCPWARRWAYQVAEG
jgi:asparagine synthase (glutamine-hydrolysing)